MLQGEHSAILSTYIKRPFVMKILIFFLFLSGRFTQVLLYKCKPSIAIDLLLTFYIKGYFYTEEKIKKDRK